MMSAVGPFFHVSREPLCITDFSGRIREANPAWLSLFGYSADEHRTTDLLDLIHEGERALAGAELKRAASGAQIAMECRMRGKDGSDQRLQLRGTPENDSQSLYFVGHVTTHDISPADLVAALASTRPGMLEEDPLLCLAQQLTSLLRVKAAIIAACADTPPTRARTRAGWSNGGRLPDVEYALEGTPCGDVIRSGAHRFHPAGAQALFPGDPLLSGFEAYVGVPLFDASGELLGHVFVVNDTPISPDREAHYVAVLSAFAQRIAPEFERLRAEESFHRIMQATESLSGTAFISELANNIASALGMRYALIAEYLEAPPRRARMVALWAGDKVVHNIVYDLEGTPCKAASRGSVVFVPERVQEAFPDDKDLVDLNAQSYLGIPLFGAEDRPIGHLAILDDRPMPPSPRREVFLKLLAGRATAELERMRAVAAAQVSEARFQLVVEHAADAILVYDRSGVVVEANPAACESLGYRRDELAGAHVARLHRDRSEGAVAREIETLVTNTPVTTEVQYQRKDGTTFPAETRIVRFMAGERDLILAVARDITERKRNEELMHSTMRAMSVPIIQVWEDVMAMPIIGHVDRERAAQAMESLLQTISQTSARFCVLDLTGVETVDRATGDHLMSIVRAAQLLGSQCLIAGISPSVARTLVDLGVGTEGAERRAGAPDSIGGLRTFSTLQAALKYALAQKGVRFARA